LLPKGGGADKGKLKIGRFEMMCWFRQLETDWQLAQNCMSDSLEIVIELRMGVSGG
jgi:hypothetical protein